MPVRPLRSAALLLPALCAAVAVGGLARADELSISSTGRILRPEPPPPDRALSSSAAPVEDWTYRGQWTDLTLQATMLSRSGAAAILTGPDGGTHMVHLGSRLGAEGAAVRGISAGRVELVWRTGAAEPARAWCLLVIERVAEVVEPTPEPEPARGRRAAPPPSPTLAWRTHHRQAACGPTADVVDPEG
ncbi:hypothetical protein L6R53_27710 [Myxococcota bacterium]|nr:hypothetical protein [Myxococcota bacterium]